MVVVTIPWGGCELEHCIDQNVCHLGPRSWGRFKSPSRADIAYPLERIVRQGRDIGEIKSLRRVYEGRVEQCRCEIPSNIVFDNCGSKRRNDQALQSVEGGDIKRLICEHVCPGKFLSAVPLGRNDAAHNFHHAFPEPRDFFFN